jgi:hypothetical protein
MFRACQKASRQIRTSYVDSAGRDITWRDMIAMPKSGIAFAVGYLRPFAVDVVTECLRAVPEEDIDLEDSKFRLNWRTSQTHALERRRTEDLARVELVLVVEVEHLGPHSGGLLRLGLAIGNEPDNVLEGDASGGALYEVVVEIEDCGHGHVYATPWWSGSREMPDGAMPEVEHEIY